MLRMINSMLTHQNGIMVKRSIRDLLMTITVLAGSLLLGQMNHDMAPSTAKPGPVTPAEAKYVCMGMGEDRLFHKELLPAEVGDKTYYGCCMGCQSRLLEDASLRVAKDPVTGRKVDKALAVIGAQQDGLIRYFESEATMKQYNDQFNKQD